MKDKKYYLRVEQDIYCSEDFYKIANKLQKIIFKFTFDNLAARETYQEVNCWDQKEPIYGIKVSLSQEKFLHWSISTSLGIKDLDREDVE